MTKKGQASIEALLILSAVLLSVTYLQVRGQNMFKTTNEIDSAKKGVQTAITRLSIQNEIKINISDWNLENDNTLIYYLTVQGGPPPENQTITSNAENIAQTYLESIGSKYNIDIKIGKRVIK